MINRFSQYLVEEENVGYLVFGRMNPPTIGHGKLLDKLASVARRAPYRIYLSQSNDQKDNPLTYSDKVKFARKMFPRHARSIIIDKKVTTPFHALSAMYDAGFKKVVLVAGSDRVQEYDVRLNKYNGKKGGHGFYNFEGGVKIVSAGQRDPDGKGAEGASGTKQRGYAKNNDFTGFAQGLTKAISNPDSRKMFNAVRKGMGLKEQKQFKNHVQLEPVSDLRESYIRDNIFELGEEVVMTAKGIIGTIKHLGTNYLIVESKGETWRCWLDQVSKVDPNQKIKMNVADHSLAKPVVESLTERYDIGTDEYLKHAIKKTPGQNKFKIEDITAEFSTEKQGSGNSTITLTSLNEAVSPQDSDIKDRKGSQPKAYHAGLKKATKVARDRHFKKHGKKADNDPSAYKPAPGDKKNKGKTKTSVWTKKFKQMYGDD